MSSRSLRVAILATFVALVTIAAGCGGGGGTSPSASTTATPPPSQSPSAPATSSAPTPSPTPLAAVPSGFKASSVTFVSPEEALVLGTAPGAGAMVVRSLDRGQSWVRLAAPSASLGRPGASAAPRLWGIRFATPEHGFVFGSGLWETVDGGRRWVRAAAPGGQVLSLATMRGQVLALVAKAGGATSLQRRPLAGGAWSTVAAVQTTSQLDPTDLISTQAGTAAVLSGAAVLVTTNGGVTFAAHATPPGSQGATPGSVAATSAGTLALLLVGQGFTGHTVKQVFTSPDGGAHWSVAGKPSSAGDGGTLAGGNPGNLVLATASAASWIDHSANGGQNWTTVKTYGDGGAGWADLGFTTATRAVVVHGPADENGNGDGRPGQLLLSSDGGASWQVVTF